MWIFRELFCLPRQKDLSDIAPLNLSQLYKAWIWMTRQMGLHRHMRRMIITLSFTTIDWLSMQSTVFELLTCCATTHCVNGIVNTDTKEACNLGQFVVVRQTCSPKRLQVNIFRININFQMYVFSTPPPHTHTHLYKNNFVPHYFVILMYFTISTL